MRASSPCLYKRTDILHCCNDSEEDASPAFSPKSSSKPSDKFVKEPSAELTEAFNVTGGANMTTNASSNGTDVELVPVAMDVANSTDNSSSIKGSGEAGDVRGWI